MINPAIQRTAKLCSEIANELSVKAFESGDSEILKVANQVNGLGRQLTDGEITPQEVIDRILFLQPPESLN